LAGTLTLSGANTKTLNFGRTVTNNGTTNLSGGTLLLDNGSLFTNNGVFNVSDDADIGGGGTPATLNNAGTFNKSGQGTTSAISRAFNNNGGTVSVDSGTVAFTNDYSQTAGSLRLNGGNVSTSSTLNLIAGSLQGTGSIAGNVMARRQGFPPAGSTLRAISHSATIQISFSKLAAPRKARNAIS
jgi:hypothetical protein